MYQYPINKEISGKWEDIGMDCLLFMEKRCGKNAHVYVPNVFDRAIKIYFEEEKQGYSLRASKGNYLVLTKPFNLKNTVRYTIIDRKNRIRGTENLIFGFGAETNEQCKAMVERLGSESDISQRNQVPLRIVKITYSQEP